MADEFSYAEGTDAPAAAAEAAPEPVGPSARVYVGNLAWSVTDEDLLEHMTAVGEVKSARVMRYDDGRSKGCAIVEFGDMADATSAIATITDSELQGRKIFVREDREAAGGPVRGSAPRGGFRGGRGRGGFRGGRGGFRGGRGGGGGGAPRADRVPGSALYVGNLPWSVTWQDLKDTFADYEPVYADVKSDMEGRSKGFGIVRFATAENAAAAIDALNGTEMEGRSIEVRLDRMG